MYVCMYVRTSVCLCIRFVICWAKTITKMGTRTERDRDVDVDVLRRMLNPKQFGAKMCRRSRQKCVLKVNR